MNANPNRSTANKTTRRGDHPRRVVTGTCLEEAILEEASPQRGMTVRPLRNKKTVGVSPTVHTFRTRSGWELTQVALQATNHCHRFPPAVRSYGPASNGSRPEGVATPRTNPTLRPWQRRQCTRFLGPCQDPISPRAPRRNGSGGALNRGRRSVGAAGGLPCNRSKVEAGRGSGSGYRQPQLHTIELNIGWNGRLGLRRVSQRRMPFVGLAGRLGEHRMPQP